MLEITVDSKPLKRDLRILEQPNYFGYFKRKEIATGRLIQPARQRTFEN